MNRTCYQIKTDRLLLDPPSMADMSAMHNIWTDSFVRRYLWDDQIISADETARILQENMRLFQKSGFGLWGMKKPEDHQLIGFAGYWYFRDPPELELIIGMLPEHSRQGYGTEAGEALIRFAFEELQFTKVVASTDAPNQAAINLMEKLNMTFDRRATIDGLETIFYALSERNWEAGDAEYTLADTSR